MMKKGWLALQDLMGSLSFSVTNHVLSDFSIPETLDGRMETLGPV